MAATSSKCATLRPMANWTPTTTIRDRSTSREQLAGYKIPKAFRVVELAAFPRSSTGKIQRHEIERLWLAPPS